MSVEGSRDQFAVSAAGDMREYFVREAREYILLHMASQSGRFDIQPSADNGTVHV